MISLIFGKEKDDVNDDISILGRPRSKLSSGLPLFACFFGSSCCCCLLILSWSVFKYSGLIHSALMHLPVVSVWCFRCVNALVVMYPHVKNKNTMYNTTDRFIIIYKRNIQYYGGFDTSLLFQWGGRINISAGRLPSWLIGLMDGAFIGPVKKLHFSFFLKLKFDVWYWSGWWVYPYTIQ